VIIALALGAVIISVYAASTVINFATQDPSLLIAGDKADEYLGADLAAGDLDDDSIDDLIIAAPWADRSSAERFGGHIYIFFGGEDRPASLNGGNADVIVIGAEAGDLLGGNFEREPGALAIGNVNGDAFDDLVIGAPEAEGGNGEVRVLFGRSRANWEVTRVIDLATVPGDVVITGVDVKGALGNAVAVGDVNGDTVGDLIIGALRSDGPASDRTDAGEVYIFFGRDTWPATPLTADRAEVRIVGAQKRAFLGSGLAVGQLGGTGIPDLAIGALSDNDMGVHVIFGSPGLASIRDLATSPANWTIRAADSGDDVGRHLAIGDVSGDGQPDLVIGVPDGDGPNNGRTDAGEVAVLFGPQSSDTTTDLAEGADFIIYGAGGASADQSNDRLGDGMDLGDFNGDGVMDVVAGARQGDGAGDSRLNAGEAYVVFGGHLPASLDLSGVNADVIIYGRDGQAVGCGDCLGRIAVGDVDGDSRDDLVLGAHTADVTAGNVLQNAGEVFVVYRQMIDTAPTPTPTTPSPVVTPSPTSPTPATRFHYLSLIVKGYSGRR
jgi:hypothetical protein